MPFALIAIGLLLVIAAYNNTQDVLGGQLKKDFSGSTGFVYWIAAIIIVGAIGYMKPMQTVSRAMLALILVVVFLTNSGVFAQFNAALAGSAGGTDANGDKGAAGGASPGMGDAPGEAGPLVMGLGKNYGTSGPTVH